MILATFAERPDLVERLRGIGEAWPEFMYHDAVCSRYWGRLHEDFADFQLVLYDEQQDRVAGQGRTVPFAGPIPGGIDGALRRAFEQGGRPTRLCALEASLDPEYQGQGLSKVIIKGMGEAARRHGLRELVAPVRPSWKHRYPLIPMRRYVAWRREDGLFFDPWLRVHERLGADLIRVCPRSMLIEGTIAEWKEWTGMVFPESGDYVVPGALVPLRVDRERDLGRYVEPNVWMRHPV